MHSFCDQTCGQPYGKVAKPLKRNGLDVSLVMWQAKLVIQRTSLWRTNNFR